MQSKMVMIYNLIFSRRLIKVGKSDFPWIYDDKIENLGQQFETGRIFFDKIGLKNISWYQFFETWAWNAPGNM